MRNACTGQSAFSCPCSSAENGGGWNGDSSIGRYANAELKTLGTNAGFGLRKTFKSPLKKRMHDGFTDSAWMSLARFADVSTSKRAVLNESILSSTCCSGSKGAQDSASSTSVKSHGGVKLLDTGRIRRAPFMNWQTRGCCPAVLPPKPMWHAEIAARYTLTVENASPLSKSSCRNVKMPDVGLRKASTPAFAHQSSNARHLPSYAVRLKGALRSEWFGWHSVEVQLWSDSASHGPSP